MIVIEHPHRVVAPTPPETLYCDYIATGRPSPAIEEYMTTNVYPYYSNPHSNAKLSLHINNLIKESRDYIKTSMNVRNDQVILFTGNGSTGATNHLIKSLNLQTPINVIISLYEHHSNFIPWKEIGATIYIVPINPVTGVIDYNIYKKIIKSLSGTIITSITACSNITGIYTDLKLLKQISPSTLLFVDFACSAPYTDIDMSFIDAGFISMHKFIGGICCPGILICNKNLFGKPAPINSGGGCVIKANTESIIYYKDLEKREEAGTINVIGQIKVKYVLMLKNMYKDVIHHNEKFITKYIHKKASVLSEHYKNFHVLFLNKEINNRLPILSFYIDNVHFNTIVDILSKKYGIQTRGGLSCCGLFGQFIKMYYNIDGFCRISFHWIMTIDEINYVFISLDNLLSNL